MTSSEPGDFLQPLTYTPFRYDPDVGSPKEYPPISAELLAARRRKQAEQLRKEGKPGLAAEKETEAQFWQGIHGLPLEHWKSADAEFYWSNGEPLTVLCIRAQKDATAAQLLRAKATMMLLRIIQLAEMGNASAAETLAKIAAEATQQLNRLVLSKPEVAKAVTPFARESESWPMLKSPKPAWGDDEEALNRVLHIGKDSLFLNDAGARTAHEKLAARVAKQLVIHVLKTGSCFEHDDKETLIIEDPVCWPKWARDASSLPPFTKGTAPKWWSIAERALLEGYPVPHEDKTLKKLVTAKSKLRSPGRMRAQILTVLKRRFHSLAPKARLLGCTN